MPTESGINNKIKVLWFTNTTSLYNKGGHHYYGGGWIESLEELISNEPNIELAISFFHNSDTPKTTKNKTIYYPIKRTSDKLNPFKKLYKNWFKPFNDKTELPKLKQVIDDFMPDVIHVFGTEGVFGLIQEEINIPVVIHLQGLVNPILNAYYPVGFSDSNFIYNKKYFLDNLLGKGPVFTKRRFKHIAKREEHILQKAKYVMGRTKWDKLVSQFFNSDVSYFHIDEVLRPIFYKEINRKQTNNDNLIILSTLSPTIYKGIDLVFKTAQLLSQTPTIKFKWQIIGLDINDKLLKEIERSLKLNHSSLNIEFLGKLKPEEIRMKMINSDVFVHPSYIDNSPNSVCEAQILGLPVIATNVGGVSSLVEDQKTGCLIPSNGVFELAHLLNTFFIDKQLLKTFGNNGKTVALKRHEKERIKSNLIDVYSEIAN